MKKRRKLRLLVVAVLFIFLLLAFSPVAAFAEDSDNGSGLAESIDELLGKLDLEELEQYLKTLTDEEKIFSERVQSQIKFLPSSAAISAWITTVF